MTTSRLIVVIGASGVGKTTLLRACTQTSWPRSWTAHIVRRTSTKRVRRDELFETECVAPEIHRKLSREGRFVVEFESYGYLYAIARSELTCTDPKTILLTALPSQVAVELVNRYEHPALTCLLEVRADVIRERLARRPSSESTDILKRRQRGASKKRRAIADVTISASGSPEVVLREFKARVSDFFLRVSE